MVTRKLKFSMLNKKSRRPNANPTATKETINVLKMIEDREVAKTTNLLPAMMLLSKVFPLERIRGLPLLHQKSKQVTNLRVMVELLEVIVLSLKQILQA